jgi:hypothetical protein
MAHRTFYVTRDQRHPLYKTRMLTAGQEITLSASAARLFGQLGAELSEEAPKRAAKVEAPQPVEEAAPAPAPTPKAEAPEPTAKKAPAKRKATRRKKSAS